MRKILSILIFILLSSLVSTASIDQVDSQFNLNDISVIHSEIGVLILPLLNNDFADLDNDTIVIAYADNDFKIYQNPNILSSHQINQFEQYLKEHNNEINLIVNSIGLTIKRNLADNEVIIIGQEFEKSQTNIEQTIIQEKESYQINYYLLSIAIVFILVIFFILVEVDKGKKTKDPINKEIKEYLTSNLNKGYDLESLKLSLVKHGYDQKKVEEVAKNI